MKLIYVEWKMVKAFLASIDEPLDGFQIIIRTKWQDRKGDREILPGRWVYEVEIPVEMIT